MILTNIAPQFGLFNGSICSFKGLLYLADFFSIKLKKLEVRKLEHRNGIASSPLDLRGGSFSSRLHQLPKTSILIRVKKQLLPNEEDVLSSYNDTESIECEFLLPISPPAMPDFVYWRLKDIAKEGPQISLGTPGRKFCSHTLQKIT